MVYDDANEILNYCHNFDWEGTYRNLFHAEDTLENLKFVDRALLFLEEKCDLESIDSSVLDLFEEIADYRDIIQEFHESFVGEEDSPYELFQQDEYVREMERELRELADDIIVRLDEIDN